MGAVAQNTHTIRTTDAARKTLTLRVPAAGVAIPAHAVVSLLVIIGNY